MSWLLLALQLILATVLLLAATGKALRSDEFLGALRLSHLPMGAVPAIAVAVPLLELGLAVALVLATDRSLPVALGATVALLAAFTAWMTWVRARHLRVRCGCFGPGGGEVGSRTIGRNALLLVLAVWGLVMAGRTESPLPDPSFPMVVAVTSLGMAVALLLALRAGVPSLALKLDQVEPGGQWDGV